MFLPFFPSLRRLLWFFKSMKQFPGAFKNNPSKLSTLLMVFLALVFLGSVSFTLIRQRGEVRKEHALRAIQKAEDDLKVARDLVGLDDKEARERVETGREELLKAERLGFPERRVRDVRVGFSQVENQILKVRPVEVQEVFDFSDIGGRIDLVDVAFVSGETLLLLDSFDSVLWQISRLNGTVPQTDAIGLDVPDDLRGISVGEDLSVVWGRKGFAELNSQLEVARTQSIDEAWGVSDVSVFSSWVYVLSAAHNQIYKFSPLNSGFSQTSWLDEDVNMDEHAKLAIDGDVYVWSNDFYKFSKGREQGFYLRTELDVPLAAVDDLVIWPGSAFIYILDSENARILQVDTHGVLQAQFRSDQLGDARALAVSGDGNRMFFVNQTKLFTVSLE